MKAKLTSKSGERRERVVVFDSGDEVKAGLEAFAGEKGLGAAHFSGIGAFAKVTVGWFDLEKQEYRPIEIDEQVELISLLGDVAESEGKAAVHGHLAVAKRDGTVHGGHLISAIVRPTLELVVVESPAHLRKTFRKEYGIALIDLERSEGV